MRTNFSHTKKLTALLMCCTALLLSQYIFAQSGTSCANAINLGQGDTCFSSTSSGTAFWNAFIADSTEVQITLNNANSSDSAIAKFVLYGGNCSNLIAIDSSIFDLPGLLMRIEGLTTGNTYYLKFIQTNGNPSQYSVCLKNGFPSATACTGCPAQLFNPNNTCELICNGSFDYYTSPPIAYSEINKACPWRFLSGTSDYFNSAGASAVSAPANNAGNQLPHSGNGYAGFCAYLNTGFEYREYVTQQLSQPLINGLCYKLSFWVSLADNSNYAVDKIGAAFTNALPVQPGFAALASINPQVVNNSIISNTGAWILITGNYIANGTEQFITIGQFVNDANTTVQNINQINSPFALSAYYFLDDVSLEPCCNTMSLSSIGPVCIGSTFNLTASSTCSPSNFSWSPINQIVGPNGANVSATVNPPGNYFDCTMTLVNYGCTTTDSILISPRPTPSVNAGSDITICKGASATLIGTGTSNFYGWLDMNSSVLCSQCTTTTVTPTVTTSYIYNALDNHAGCTDFDTMTVFVIPGPVIHIVIPPGAVTCDGAFTFTAIGVPSGASYLWHSNLPSVGTGNTFSVDWPNYLPTDGYVILDVIDVNGCLSHDSVVIPHCCCGGNIGIFSLDAINDNVDSLIAHYPTYVIVSGNSTSITGQSLCINGVFTVNRNLDLKNVAVSMGTNAKINILPGFTLTLRSIGNLITQQTIVQACDKMWDGIYINPGAILKVKDGTVIEDGKQAIVSVNGGAFQIDGGGGSGPVKLNKNLIAVWVKPFNGTHTGFIRNAIISCDAPLQPGSTALLPVTSAGPNLIAPYATSLGYIGVRIDSCTNITIGDSTQNNFRNLFERTRYGIYATRSNVNVWNNDFKFIQSTYQPSHSNPFPDGVAIYANNKMFVPIHTLTVGKLGTKKANNKFRECSYGVMAENQMNLNCENNKFDSCFVIGIFSQNNNFRTTLINLDTLHDCTGINIDCYKVGNGFISITNNAINQNANAQPNNFGQTGIYVANAITSTAHLLIQNNSIKKMRNGIWVSRVNNAKIIDNGPITFIPGQPYSLTTPATGIHVDASMNVAVRNNVVKYALTPTVALYDKMFGIYVENCRNDTVTKNHLVRVGSGIFMKGADNPSLLACNRMDTCWYGINFNLVNNVSTAVSINDQFLYQNSTPTQTGNIWNGINAPASDLAGKIMPINNNGIHWYRNAYIPTMGALVTGSIFGNTTQPVSSNQCSNLLAPLPVSDIAKRDYLLGGICKTPRIYDTLSSDFSYNDQEFAYRTLRDNPSWLNLGTSDDIYYQHFYDLRENSNEAVLAEVEDDIAAENISQAQIDLAKYDPKNILVDTIVPSDSTLAGLPLNSATQEANRIAVLGVYLQSWAIDSLVLTDDQRNILIPIANEGCITGGNSVFDARNMLQMEVHDSSNMRISHQTETQSISISHIYPNPTTGQISIAVDISDGENGEMDIFDLMGRKIAAWQLIGGQKIYTFDASFLSSGTYIYCIISHGKIITTDRLIMMREE